MAAQALALVSKASSWSSRGGMRLLLAEAPRLEWVSNSVLALKLLMNLRTSASFVSF